MRVAGRDQMGHPQWYTEVKMQELQVAVFVPPEGHLEIQPVSVVQEIYPTKFQHNSKGR